MSICKEHNNLSEQSRPSESSFNVFDAGYYFDCLKWIVDNTDSNFLNGSVCSSRIVDGIFNLSFEKSVKFIIKEADIPFKFDSINGDFTLECNSLKNPNNID